MEAYHMSGKPHTGEKVPESGIYQPSGGGSQVALSKGDRLPPSDGKKATYDLVQKTKKQR